MSTSDTIRILLEFLAIIIAVTAMVNEKRFIELEDKFVKFVLDMKEIVSKRCKASARRQER